MALATLSPILSELRGAAGTDVARTIRGNTVIRKTYRQYKLIDNKGSFQKSNFLQIIRLWSSLSDSQRIAWNNLASQIIRTNRVGYKNTLTGYGLFSSCNLNAYPAAGTFILDAPSISDIALCLCDEFFIDTSLSDVSCNVNFLNDTGNIFRLFASAPVSLGSNSFGVIRSFSSGNCSWSGAYDVASDYYSVFPNALLTNCRVKFILKVLDYDTGFYSIPYSYIMQY